MFNDVLNMITI